MNIIMFIGLSIIVYFLLIVKMSLLDQLSSLCIQSTYGNSVFSFTNNQQVVKAPVERHDLHIATQNNSVKDESNVSASNQHSSNSQQKIIKLFDDEQLQPNWRYIKTDKKPPQSRQQVFSTAAKQQKTVSSQFTIQTPQKNNQSLLMTLTKMSYMIKNKLRKTNYEFFVRLEKYNKHLQKQQKQGQIEAKANEMLQMQCFITRLNEAIGVIELKYFNVEIGEKGAVYGLSDAFKKIKEHGSGSIKLDKLVKISRKLVFKKFFTNLHQHNKRAIKIDLFYELISTIIMKKLDANKMYFLMAVKQNTFKKKDEVKSHANQHMQSERLQIFEQKQYETPKKTRHLQAKQTIMINISQRLPTRLHPLKAADIRIRYQQSLFSNQQKQKPQHIPLKQHKLKPHDQQINLNDCVDNGHLLMAQIKANASLFQQLEKPANFNNTSVKNSNSTVISQYLSSENFTTTHMSNDFTERMEVENDKMRKTLYGHQKAKTTSIVSSMNPPRKSLVVAKRKQSINQISTYANSPRNTQRQKFNAWSNKPKSTNTSVTKINHKQAQVRDKQIIKKMLQQLNQKFACHDKVINITLSNKKHTQTQKKQSYVNPLAKKAQRKKVHSQLISNSCAINCNGQGQKQLNSIKNERFNDNITRIQNKNSEQLKFQNQIEQNDYPISFVPAQIEQSEETIKRDNPSNAQERQQHRMNQSRSQMSKKNPNLQCQQSDSSDIYRALAKLKTKKTQMPESNLKIDLLTTKNNYYLCHQQKPQHHYNQNSFLSDNKLKNSLFFRDRPSLSLSKDCQQQLCSSKLSMIAPKSLITGIINEPGSQVKHYKPQQLSPSKDSAIAQYLGYLPSQCQPKQAQRDNYFSNYAHSNYSKNRYTQSTYLYEMDEGKKRMLKPTSVERKMSSVEKNKDEWDLMFEKQKKKFLKHEDAPRMVKRKSLLNEEVITELKNKIQQCFILGQRDQNTINTDLTMKKAKKDDSLFLKEKVSNYEPIKTLSLQGSKKNSSSKLYATLSKLRRPEP